MADSAASKTRAFAVRLLHRVPFEAALVWTAVVGPFWLRFGPRFSRSLENPDARRRFARLEKLPLLLGLASHLAATSGAPTDAFRAYLTLAALRHSLELAQHEAHDTVPRSVPPWALVQILAAVVCVASCSGWEGFVRRAKKEGWRVAVLVGLDLLASTAEVGADVYTFFAGQRKSL
ncbi:hypothetical protein DFJ74DRAFT_681943 [Hyaloraphidium curvatum]|nr:hypothetical protein DFJ74DRAFT_681943 [Hyaloraphidium curvatum]